MLNIAKNVENGEMDIALEGRLDTTTAPSLDAEIKGGLEGITSLKFDLAKEHTNIYLTVSDGPEIDG